MQEKYYLLDPSGGKIGPVDIVELTRWARDGRLLPENTICDEYGNKCNARDIISFVKVVEQQPKSINTVPYLVTIFILAFIACISVVAYLGMRANYNKLDNEYAKLKQEYTNIETNVKELEKRNEETQKEATEFIGKLVQKYNLMEKEKDNLTDQLGSLQQENRSLKDLRESIEEAKEKTIPMGVEAKDTDE